VFGVVLRGPASNTTIEGNFIGTNAAGTVAQPNLAGIGLLLNTSNNVIQGNLISGNSAYGIIAGAQSTVTAPVTGTRIYGNYIGTDKGGTLALGNGIGVALNSTDGSLVGGTAAGQPNVIANSTGAGVAIGSSGTGYVAHGNTVQGNSIFANGGLGIDLTTNLAAPDGLVTANSGQLISATTNGHQNFPELQFIAGGPITRLVGTLTIGALDVRPNPATYTIDVYANAAQVRQGKRYLGSLTVEVGAGGAGGAVAFDEYRSWATQPGEYLTATATDASGNTSEFSAPMVALAGAGDADSDGLANLVDTAPTTFSNAFSDVGLNGGATTGTITSRGDQVLTITDALNPADGIQILSGATGGSTPATIIIDGGATNLGGQATLTINAGANLIATHGSVILNVIAGTVGVSFKADSGAVVASASLPPGASLTFKPDTVTFVATSTNTQPAVQVVLVGASGQQATASLAGGNEIVFNPQTFAVTAPVSNPQPVQITAANGETITVSPGHTVSATVQAVTIDIQPESLNLDSNGVLTVMIFGALNFNVSQINVASVRFAGAAATQWTLVDANHDGRLDMQLKFRRQDTILDQIYADLLSDDHDADGVLDTTRQLAQVALTGRTQSDAHFAGSDGITLFLSGRSLRNLIEDLFD
jgi:hypothetical protein